MQRNADHNTKSTSTTDTFKNCAKSGKGFKIGTNETYNIKIKSSVKGILTISCFCLWLPQTKAFH